MKVSTRLITAMLVIPMALGSLSAFAYSGNHNKSNGMMKGNHMLHGIDLTAEQKTQLDSLRDNFRDQRHANKNARKEMTTERAQMQSLLLAAEFDEKQALGLAKKMVGQQTERRISMLKHQHDMLAILTPEQKEQVKENMQGMATRHNDRMRNHH